MDATSLPLFRLARALAGGSSTYDLPRDAVYVDGFAKASAPAQVSFASSQAPPASPSAAAGRARLLTYAGRTQSLLRWSQELGLDRRVLAWRLNRGWPIDQALGFAPHPPRDRVTEQARSLATQANTKVLIVDPDGSIIPRAEAAARLGIKLRSLTHRLRQYRPADGSNTRVPFSLLDRR